MGSITWTRVATIPFVDAGCGLRGVCCMHNGTLLAFFEEGPSATNPQRMFTSADHGRTWTEGTPFLEDPFGHWNLVPGRLLNLSANTAIVGSASGVETSESAGGFVPLTTDLGESWQNTTASIATEDITPQGTGFVVLDNNEVWVTGRFWDVPNDITYAYLKSTTGGLSGWTLEQPNLLISPNETEEFTHDGVFLDSGRVVLGMTTDGSPHVAISDDRGQTFSRVQLPHSGTALFSNVQAMAKLESALIAVGECISTTLTWLARAWRSTDEGQTWSEITSAMLGGIVATSQSVNHVLALGGDRAVLMMDGNAFSGSHHYWRLTEDAGLTWTITSAGASMPSTNATAATQQMAIAEDNAIIATVHAGNSAAPGEIWRGEVSGFTVTSPCAGATAVQLGVHQECVSAFLPAPCPQVCDEEP